MAPTLGDLFQYIGRTVRTEDDTMFNCGVSKSHESKEHADWHRSPVHGDDACCSPNDTFGGEGVVDGIAEDEGVTYLLFDWGYAMPVLPTTVIIDVTEERSNG